MLDCVYDMLQTRGAIRDGAHSSRVPGLGKLATEAVLVTGPVLRRRHDRKVSHVLVAHLEVR